MSAGTGFYKFNRKVHLYAALTTVVLVLMYIVTSYMMIYHDFFKTHESKEIAETLAISRDDIHGNNWQKFMKDQGIQGRQIAEFENEKGDLVRRFDATGERTTVTIFRDGGKAEIRKNVKSTGGKVVGWHRMRGYGGPWQYNLYAFLLDLTGVGLILFAVTGVIMWLKILNHNRIAWAIFILGLLYVTVILGYLLTV